MINEQEAIQEIRKHANANYNKGWDVVVEAYDDGDLLEELSENGMNVKKTIKSLQGMVRLRNQQMKEHQAEARSSY